MRNNSNPSLRTFEGLVKKLSFHKGFERLGGNARSIQENDGEKDDRSIQENDLDRESYQLDTEVKLPGAKNGKEYLVGNFIEFVNTFKKGARREARIRGNGQRVGDDFF